MSATTAGQQPKTSDQLGQAWASASVPARPAVAGEAPSSPGAGHVENGEIADIVLRGAKTCQSLYQMALKLGLWKLLKSRQIMILASHRALRRLARCLHERGQLNLDKAFVDADSTSVTTNKAP